MLRRWKKPLLFAGLGSVILSVWLFLVPWLNIFPAGAQNFLEEDERLALELWGDTRDPNIEAILTTQVVTGDLTLGEVHLGYDKASGALLEDPTISRDAFQVTGLKATELKQGSDIDPGRIRFGSDYQWVVEPGFAPELQEQLARAALPGASGEAEIPYVVIQFNFPVDLEVKQQLEKSGVVFGDPIDKLSLRAGAAQCLPRHLRPA